MKLSETPFISVHEIQERVADLAEIISQNYAQRELLLVTVLKGSAVFAADLMRALNRPLQLDYVRVRSYNGGESTGAHVFTLLPEAPLAGQHVLVVEDILDTGLTATAILERLRAAGPASLALCTLLDKPSRRRVAITADYVGFTIDEIFVVGYGLDYNERFRELPDLRVLTL
ncbi:MAG: hypoxanthine phosphoribosyltransferase [Candidatus Hydrogenedentes bacterium]|nr:hypoxanthine phosphoribosyltransferase [Candidatus Hydrogenedentota bacterium]